MTQVRGGKQCSQQFFVTYAVGAGMGTTGRLGSCYLAIRAHTAGSTMLSHQQLLTPRPPPIGRVEAPRPRQLPILGNFPYSLLPCCAVLAEAMLNKCVLNVCKAGNELLASGYCLYSSSTVLVLTVGEPVSQPLVPY